jgi:hypothetical protein
MIALMIAYTYVFYSILVQESLKIKKPGGKVRLARMADNLATSY